MIEQDWIREVALGRSVVGWRDQVIVNDSSIDAIKIKFGISALVLGRVNEPYYTSDGSHGIFDWATSRVSFVPGSSLDAEWWSQNALWDSQILQGSAPVFNYDSDRWVREFSSSLNYQYDYGLFRGASGNFEFDVKLTTTAYVSFGYAEALAELRIVDIEAYSNGGMNLVGSYMASGGDQWRALAFASGMQISVVPEPSGISLIMVALGLCTISRRARGK